MYKLNKESRASNKFLIKNLIWVMFIALITIWDGRLFILGVLGFFIYLIFEYRIGGDMPAESKYCTLFLRIGGKNLDLDFYGRHSNKTKDFIFMFEAIFFVIYSVGMLFFVQSSYFAVILEFLNFSSEEGQKFFLVIIVFVFPLVLPTIIGVVLFVKYGDRLDYYFTSKFLKKLWQSHTKSITLDEKIFLSSLVDKEAKIDFDKHKYYISASTNFLDIERLNHPHSSSVLDSLLKKQIIMSSTDKEGKTEYYLNDWALDYFIMFPESLKC